ncbi:hypothetical protein F2P79_025296, partial [Pimephales promelas]
LGPASSLTRDLLVTHFKKQCRVQTRSLLLTIKTPIKTTPQTADQQCTWNLHFISLFGGPIFLEWTQLIGKSLPITCPQHYKATRREHRSFRNPTADNFVRFLK